MVLMEVSLAEWHSLPIVSRKDRGDLVTNGAWEKNIPVFVREV
jgi:hypothetical protein